MNYKMKELPIEERPRERMKTRGKDFLTEKELLSILLKTGTKEKSAETLAVELLKTYSLQDLKDISIENLIKIKGIGEVKAIELLAAIQLGKRIFLKQSTPKEKMDNPNKIWSSSRYLFYGKKQELFYCYFLDHKKQLIERKLLFMGTTNQATTHTREIFKEAYLVSASSIVCLHNHPSNDVRPSKEDIRFTKRLMEIGMLQGIPVVDHIIVGDHSYYSFYEHSNVLNI